MFKKKLRALILFFIVFLAGFLTAIYLLINFSLSKEKITGIFSHLIKNPQSVEKTVFDKEIELTNGCININLATDYSLYEYTHKDNECTDYQRIVNPFKFSTKCQNVTGSWRNYWVRTINVSQTDVLNLKADLTLVDHQGIFEECGGQGVKYDDYVDFMILEQNPKIKLQKECNRIYSTGEELKCLIDNTTDKILAHCGMEKCTTNKKCDLEIDVSQNDKVYLVFRTADAWENADIEGILANLVICSQKKGSIDEESNLEADLILNAARNYIQSQSDSQVRFDLKLVKTIGRFALVQVAPRGGLIEGAAVILEKVKGEWVVQEMGTIFPEWEEKVPELFQW